MGGTRVALDLDQGNGRPDSKVIDRTVLPTLMEQPVRILSLVFDEVIAIEVAVDFHPSVSRGDRGPQILR